MHFSVRVRRGQQQQPQQQPPAADGAAAAEPAQQVRLSARAEGFPGAAGSRRIIGVLQSGCGCLLKVCSRSISSLAAIVRCWFPLCCSSCFFFLCCFVPSDFVFRPRSGNGIGTIVSRRMSSVSLPFFCLVRRTGAGRTKKRRAKARLSIIVCLFAVLLTVVAEQPERQRPGVVARCVLHRFFF